MKAVLTITLIIAACPVQAVTYCERFAMKAYDLQWDRQHGFKQDYEPGNRMEHAMSVQVFQQPQYTQHTNKLERAEKFAREWKRACQEGVYE